MTHEPALIVDKGSGVMYRHWPAVSADAVFLLVHGLGAQSARWRFSAGLLGVHGAVLYAIELRGFGETQGPRGHVKTFRTYYSDIFKLAAVIRSQNPGLKLFLLGESMGGLIAFCAQLLKPELADGLICLSPAFGNRLAFGLTDYLRFVKALMFKPETLLTAPFDAAMVTRDEDVRDFMDTDTREHRFASASLLREILLAQWRSMIPRQRCRIPVLFQLAGHDRLVDPGAARLLFRRLQCPDKTLLEYTDMYHALSVERGRERVFADTVEWYKKRVKAA
jgi:alpha-beta hydrolase superfamily lysophospholipase